MRSGLALGLAASSAAASLLAIITAASAHWSRVPVLTVIAVTLSVAAWLLAEEEGGEDDAR